MANEANKELVTRTWRALTGGDAAGALANLTDDVSWVLPASLPQVGGVKEGKATVGAFLAGIGQAFPKGLQTEFRNVYADGDAVIVELTNRGTAANGRAYENEYCFVFEIAGAKIRRIREYVATLKVKQILFD